MNAEQKLLSKYKKLKDEQKKYSTLAEVRRQEYSQIGYDIRKLMGAKLDALKDGAFNPLHSYRWVGHFREVGGYPGTRFLCVVITANKRRVRLPDPLEKFFGEAIATMAGGLPIPLQPGIVLYDMRDSWEIRFGERGHTDKNLDVPNERITAYIRDRHLRVKMKFHEMCDYLRSKQYLAECEAFMKLIGQEVPNAPA